MKSRCKGTIKEIRPIKELTRVRVQQFIFTKDAYYHPITKKLVSDEMSYLIQAMNEACDLLAGFKPNDRVQVDVWINGIETFSSQGEPIYKNCIRLKYIKKLSIHEN